MRDFIDADYVIGEPPPRKPRKDQVNDWLTWVARAVIVAIGAAAVHQNDETQDALRATQAALQTVEITLMKVSTQQDFQSKQLDEHSQNLQKLWEQQRRRENQP